MVMKNKSISKKSVATVPAGPSGKMMHRQATGAQKPGVSSQEHSATKSKGPVKGGSGKMFGKQSVKTLKPA